MYTSQTAASGTGNSSEGGGGGGSSAKKVLHAAFSPRLPKQMTFDVEPQEICFRDFEPHQTYEATLHIRNTTKQVQFLRIAKPQSRFLSVKAPRNCLSTTKVAPGLSLAYKVLFTPEENRDFSCDLVVTTEHEEFTIPVQAIASRGRLTLPDSFAVTSCPVRGSVTTALFLRNTGAQACQWRAEAQAPFSITPSCGTVQPDGGGLYVTVGFAPQRLQSYSSTIAFLLGPEEDMVQELPVTGDAIEVAVALDQSILKMPQTFVTLESQVVVRVKNDSDHTVRFAWKSDRTESDELVSTRKNIIAQREDVAQAAREQSPNAATQMRLEGERLEALANVERVFDDDVFTIEPVRGIIYAKGWREFVVTFNPQLAMDYLATAYLDIDGRQNRLPLQVSGTGIGPQCELEYTHLDIGDICVGARHEYEVGLTNRGCIEARYTILPSENIMGSKFSFFPSTGVLAPGTVNMLIVRLQSDIVGVIGETFRVHLHGSLEDLTLRFRGFVTGPSLRFDVEELDFGNVSYNCKHSRVVHMLNNGKLPIDFRLRISSESNLTLQPSEGHIPPGKKYAICVDFVSNMVGDYESTIIVDVLTVGDAVDTLRVRAACLVPALSLAVDHLHYGACFVGHEYKMNLEVVNNTALVGKFEVILLNKDIFKDTASVVIGASNGEDSIEIISPRSRLQVPVLLTPLAVGDLRLSLYVRVLGSDEPPLPVLLTASACGPTITLESSTISFGKVQLLEQTECDLVINNTSLVSAFFTAHFASRHGCGVFSLGTQEGEIMPNSSTVIRVAARLDDARTFTDKIEVCVKYVEEPHVVEVTATGKGYALVPVDNIDRVDFGSLFTETSAEKEITIVNQGRRDIGIMWSGLRAARTKPGASPVVFRITPETAVIPAGQPGVFTVNGFVDIPGQFTEEFVLKDKNDFKAILQTTITGNFINPVIAYNTKRVTFEYIYGAEGIAGCALTTKTFSMRNSTSQPLEVSLRIDTHGSASSPFSLVEPTVFTLPSDETRIVGVTFDALYRGDSVAHTLKNRILVSFMNHPHTEHVSLMATIAFPTIRVHPDGPVNFGSILVDTESRMPLKLTNLSNIVAAHFEWNITADEEALDATITTQDKQRKYFDFVPFRGTIPAGSTCTVDAVFYGARGRHGATATCRLAGGPSYDVKLVGWSDVTVKFDCTTVDFGVMHHQTNGKKAITITSPSRVAVPFSVDLSSLRYPGAVSVTPLKGVVTSKVLLTVNFTPLIPDEVIETFHVQVGHMNPQPITVRGFGQLNAFAVASMDRHVTIARVEDASYQACLKELAEKEWIPYYKRAGIENQVHRVDPITIEAERVSFCRFFLGKLEATENENNNRSNGKGKKKPEVVTARGSEEPKDILSRYVVDFGHMTRLETRTARLALVNTSVSSVSLVLEKRVIKTMPFTVEPLKIPTIPPSSEIELSVTFDAGDTEKVAYGVNVFEFTVDILRGPRVIVEIHCFVATPVLTPSDLSVDFGEVLVGHIRKVPLVFANKEAVPCTWRMTLIESKRKEEEPASPTNLHDSGVTRKQFRVNADHGTLAPGDSMTVELSFMPRYIGKASAKMRMRYMSNLSDQIIHISGTVTSLAVEISPSPLEFTPVFPCQATRHIFTIKNNEARPVEVFSMNVDQKHKSEVSMLRLALARKTTGERALYLPIRRAGESLPLLLVKSLYDALLSDQVALEYKGVALEQEMGARSRSNSRHSLRLRPPTSVQTFTPRPTNTRTATPTHATEQTPGSPLRCMKPQLLVLVGPPFSGKTTQTRRLAKEFGLCELDMDAMVRAEAEIDTAEGELIRNILEEAKNKANNRSGTTGVGQASNVLLSNTVAVNPNIHTVGAANLNVATTTLVAGAGNATQKQKKVPIVENLAESPVVMILYALLTRYLGREAAGDGVIIDDVRSVLTENRQVVLYALNRAAAAVGMELTFLDLSVCEATTGLRRSLALKAECELAVAEALTHPLTEEEYEQISAEERDAYSRRLLHYNQCKRALADATASVARFTAEREGTPQKSVQELVDEAISAREEQEALIKASMKGKKFVPEPRPPPVWVQLSELDQYRELYMLLREVEAKAHVVVDGEQPEEAVQSFIADDVFAGILFTANTASAFASGRTPSPRPASRSVVTDPSIGGNFAPEECTYGLWELIDEDRVNREYAPFMDFRLFSLLQREVVPRKGQAKTSGAVGGAAAAAPNLVLEVEERTRWVVPPLSSVDVTVVFCNDRIGQHPTEFVFGITGTSQEIVLPVAASTAYPEISRDERSIFSSVKSRVIAGRQMSKVYIASKRTYDFGPLIIPGTIFTGSAGNKREKQQNQQQPPSSAPLVKRTSDSSITNNLKSSSSFRDAGAEDKMTFTNTGIFPAEVSVTFAGRDRDRTFTATPNKFTLPIGEKMDVVLRAAPEVIGEITSTLIVTIRDNPTPWYVTVSCIGTRPAVTLNGQRESLVQFGRCLLMRQMVRVVTLANNSSVPVRWRIPSSDRLPREFEMNSLGGVLDVNGVYPLEISFKPIRTGIHNVALRIEVADVEQDCLFESLPLVIKAESHDVVLEWTRQIDFKLLHVGEARKETVRILNKGPYDVGYLLRLPKCLQGLITLTPSEGILRGLVGFKDAALVNVEVLIRFDREGEIPAGLGVIEASFFDPVANELLYPVQNISVSAEAWYNRFVVKPSCIDFGSCVAEQKKQSTFELRNIGRFPLTFRLFNYKAGPDDELLVNEIEESGTMGTTTSTLTLARKQSKGAKVDVGFRLGAFTVSPSKGSVDVGATCVFQVITVPGDKTSHKETLGIYVDQCEPETQAHGIPFELVASPTTPGIAADLSSPVNVETIFEEQQIVTCLAQCNKFMRAYAREERVFSFGMILVGSYVMERFRISNSSPLACSVRVQLLPKYPRETKESKKDPSALLDGFEIVPDNVHPQSLTPNQKASTPPTPTSKGQSSTPSVSFATNNRISDRFELSPFESHYVTVCFAPLALQSFNAYLEAVVIGGLNPKTGSVRFELCGEGILPSVEYILPPRLVSSVSYLLPNQPPAQKRASKSRLKDVKRAQHLQQIQLSDSTAGLGADIIQFPLTLVGTSSTRSFTIRNVGDVAAHIRLFAPDDDLTRDIRVEKLKEEILLPIGGSETFNMTFTPKEVTKRRVRLRVSVTENPYEDRSLFIVCESFFQLISFENVDPGSEEHLSLGHWYMERPKEHTITLRNNSQHTTRFEWESPSSVLRFTPSIGHIAPGATHSITLCLNCDVASKETLNCRVHVSSIKLISSTAEDVGNWDVTQVKSKWVMAAADECDSVTSDVDPARRILRKVVESVPEPLFKVTGDLSLQKTLYVSYSCEPTSYKLTLPLNDNVDAIDTIMFPLVKIFQRRSVVLRVTNTGQNALPFSFALGETEIGGPNVFSVDPVSDTVEPREYRDVNITYAPRSVENANTSLIGTFSYAASPKVYISLQGTTECPQVHFNVPPCDYLTTRIDGEAGTDLNPETIAVLFKSCGLQNKVNVRFKVINPSAATYRFEWISDPMSQRLSPFRCLTPSGTILPGKQGEMAFEYTSTTILGVREAKWSFVVAGLLSVPFLLVGTTESPDVFLHQSKLNFGGVSVGNRNERVVELENREDVSFPFAFDQASIETGTTFVTVKPMSGIVPPKSRVPITVIFFPKEEVSVNTKLTCRIKRAVDPLTINVKGDGLRIHTSLRIEDEENGGSEPIEVQPSQTSYLNLGRVQVDTVLKKNLVLTNDGRLSVDYFISLPENSFLKITPMAGKVPSMQQATLCLEYAPTAEESLRNLKVQCRIDKVNMYSMRISVASYIPKLNLNFQRHDFGPCFIAEFSAGAVVSALLSMMNGEAKENIVLDCVLSNAEVFELDSTSFVLRPGEMRNLKISFAPREVNEYCSELKIILNGSHPIYVPLIGEGVVPRIDVQNRFLKLGVARIGERRVGELRLECRSRAPTPVSLANCVDAFLLEKGVSFSPSELVVMRPREVLTVNVSYKPTTRMAEFQHEVRLVVCGREMPFAIISGSCEDAEVHLNLKNIVFSDVVAGATASRRIVIMNSGDILQHFKWDLALATSSEMKIIPVTGVVRAHAEQTCELVYSPKKSSSSFRRAVVVEFDNAPPLSVNVEAQGAELPRAETTLEFNCRPRSEETRNVSVENPTDGQWIIRPVIESKLWTAPKSVVVSPRSTATFPVTYAPTFVSKLKDLATLFIPLPNGEAKCIALEGNTTNPNAAAAVVERVVEIGASHTERFEVQNATTQPLRFTVNTVWKNEPEKGTLVVKSPVTIDIPSRQTRECGVVFCPSRDGAYRGTVYFRCPEYDEHTQSFEILLKVVPKAISSKTELVATVRTAALHRLPIANHLQKPITLNVKVENGSDAVFTDPSITIKPKSTAELPIRFFPLVHKDYPVATVTASNPELGVTTCKLSLRSNPPPLEKVINVTCSLGQTIVIPIHFVHYCKSNCDFVLRVPGDPKTTPFSKVGAANSIKVPGTTSPDGQNVTIELQYEPTSVGETREMIEVYSVQAGLYIFPIVANCIPPQRLGPVMVRQGQPALIPFKNVFLDTITINMTTDSPAFTVAKATENVASKKVANIQVQYKGADVGSAAPQTGKLTVTSAAPGCREGETLQWVYYLKRYIPESESSPGSIQRKRRE